MPSSLREHRGPKPQSLHHRLTLQDRRLEEWRGTTQLRRRRGGCEPEESVRCSRDLAAVGRLDDQALGGGEPAANIGDLGYDGGAAADYQEACHVTGYHEVRVLLLLYEADRPLRLGQDFSEKCFPLGLLSFD